MTTPVSGFWLSWLCLACTLGLTHVCGLCVCVCVCYVVCVCVSVCVLSKMHSCAFGHMLSYNILRLCVHDWTAKTLTGLMRYLLCNSLLILLVSHCTVYSCGVSQWKRGRGSRYKGQLESRWPAGDRLGRARTLGGGWGGRGAEGLSRGHREAKASAGSSRGGCSSRSRDSRPRGPCRLVGKQGSCRGGL